MLSTMTRVLLLFFTHKVCLYHLKDIYIYKIVHRHQISFSLVILSILRMVSKIQQGNCPSIYLFDDISVVQSFFENSFRSYDVLFSYFSFISAKLIVSIFYIPHHLQFSFSPSILILSWFCSSIPCYLSFTIFHYEHCIFLCQIYFLYLDCIFLFLLLEFLILFHFLQTAIHVHQVMQFRKFAATSSFRKYVIE